MTRIDYMLKIYCSDERMSQVSKVLGVDPTEVQHGYWGLEVSDEEIADGVDAVGRVLGLLDGKFEDLERIGVARSDVSIWLFVEYQGQCSLLFTAQDLCRIAEKKLDLCIECWEVSAG